jgi:peptidoglycan/LPS O-acetylase OafA/YrhL
MTGTSPADPIGQSPSPQGGAGLPYAPALDGARALAVGMVMAYHLGASFLPGGFLGVDLFFVLSGFLITTLLMREHRQRDRISLTGFWLRRARRLLPALFLVLAAVAVWALVASPFERDGIRLDILSSLGYAVNWRFIAEGQSYFDEFASPSPVQHLWSLAIEEQFYVLWPILVVGAFVLGRRARPGFWAPVVALVVAIGASAALQALAYDEYDPSVAYFATHTRAHELLIGALGAVLVESSPRFRLFVRRAAPVVGAAALVVLIAFFVLMPDTSPVYFLGGSVVFSVAAIAVVLSVTGRRGDRHPVGRVFALRPLVTIGLISYGLYLWHWPVFLWLSPERTGIDGPLLAGLRVGATLAIAGLSFVLIERPIRRGSIGRFRLGVRPVVIGAASAAVAVAGLTLVTTRDSQPVPEFVANNRSLIAPTSPDADVTIGLVGDSVAMSLYPGLVLEAGQRGYQVAAATFPGCPLGEIERVDRDGVPIGFARRCPETAPREQERLVERYDPPIVFWLSARERLTIRIGDEVMRTGTPEWEEAAFEDWDRVYERLSSRGAHVVLVLPFHRPGVDPNECAGEAGLADPACTGPSLSTNSLREEYRRWAARHPDGVTVLDPDPHLCPANPCPSQIDGMELFSDRVHLTVEAAEMLADRLVAELPPDLLRGVQAGNH